MTMTKPVVDKVIAMGVAMLTAWSFADGVMVAT